MKVAAAAAVLTLIPVSMCVAADLGVAIFTSESVTLDVERGMLHVIGDYRFSRGECQEPLAIFFPIIDSPPLGAPRMISVTIRRDAGQEQPLEWSSGLGGIQWTLPFPECTACEVEIHYDQTLSVPRAEYILTTARGWPEAIRHARFEVRLPPGASEIRSSYELASLRIQGRTVYVFEENHFLPDRDLIVEWQER